MSCQDLTFIFTGPKGTITCIAAFLVCQSIFNSILTIAGNINVSVNSRRVLAMKPFTYNHAVMFIIYLDNPRAFNVFVIVEHQSYNGNISFSLFNGSQ